MELLYHNGARIELNGPCIIETISEKETFLTMGTVDVVADSLNHRALWYAPPLQFLRIWAQHFQLQLLLMV